ncbi:HAD family hydrolase [Paraburkholderia phenazinium]|jgi:HAD superfamily hydrolase (TIGR01549 family)|uniref:Haloacid dehalogenase superfamily, subfamily IA, variant 1 with third motif having Dx(3-4)D or Dx(3-4)E n=1 Tax=Paraburkholderia phenazinium TaxID=60549 RepID=A0A1G8A6V9_9BURK|nr:HAD family hydrolase [Paraburkholderia phenazinium]SDH16684.1 haloacid dehalogenase superfamily, subfamily IA, variant 1 with third motif having Dx(3-4)D or Dx(3-4)E [Paraburkholderia phenazinium]
MTIRAVFFDVGETLIDESRDWGGWADYLGVSHLSFFATLGAVIERGEHHRTVFKIVRPDVEFSELHRQRRMQGKAYSITPNDFYPDAIPCLARLQNDGVLIGIAGNQPLEAEQALRKLGVPADIVASSASWHVEKPAPEFFERVIAATNGLAPSEIAYVGDRLDNDIEPALRAGMVPVFIRRGPWAHVQLASRRFQVPPHIIDELTSLPELLRGL